MKIKPLNSLVKAWPWILGGLGAFAAYKIIFGSASLNDNGTYDFNSVATRELRAKNPLGVSLSTVFDWEGVDTSYPGRANKNVPGDELVPGVDNLLGDHLIVFRTTQDGLNAAAWLLHDNYFKPGVSDTPETLGNKWAGDDQNKANAAGRQSYGDAIASIMKDTPFQHLIYGADGPGVMAALAREENGSLPVAEIPAQMYRVAIQYGEAS